MAVVALSIGAIVCMLGGLSAALVSTREWLDPILVRHAAALLGITALVLSFAAGAAVH
jgi:multidrug efflux pump subunit AcrB